MATGAVGLLGLLALFAAIAAIAATARGGRVGWVLPAAAACCLLGAVVVAPASGSHPTSRLRAAPASAATPGTVPDDLPPATFADESSPTSRRTGDAITVAAPAAAGAPASGTPSGGAVAASSAGAPASSAKVIRAHTGRTPGSATGSASVAPTQPAVAAAASDPAAEVQRALDTWLNSQDAASSVAVGYASVADGSVGTAEAHRGQAATAIHAGDGYGILSITKTFTEALVLRQVEAGRIDLDAPMPPLPGIDPPPDGVVITARMLLEHTAGLVDYSNAAGYDETKPITPAQTVTLALHTPLLFPPGTRASYSRTNFHWLGVLLEQVTGKSFGQQIAELADQYGLTHTSLDPTGRPGWTGGASGGVTSTVGDIAKWGAALFTPGKVLSPEHVAALVTPGPHGVGLGTWPACPCSVDTNGVKHLEAMGQIVANGGFLYFPREQLAVVVHVDPVNPSAGDQTSAVAGLVRSVVAG